MSNSMVLELQKEAMDPAVRVSDLLRRSLVVATKLGAEEFRSWAQQELDGYAGQDSTPKYRRIRGQLRAHNPYNGWIPVVVQDKNLRESLESRDAGDPISSLEDNYVNSQSSHSLQIPLPHDVLVRVFGETEEFRLGMIPTLLIAKPALRGILDGVRNEIVRWTLEIERGGAISDRDFLTNLLNREAFDRALDLAIGEAGRLGEPLSLVMVDIDHFKRINDNNGHQAGDAILKAVSTRLASVTRVKGQAFRYGGEELVLLLPNHSIQEGIAVAERARIMIESMPAADNLHVTASFGVGCFPDAPDAAMLVKAADEAMYDAKNHGRNMVRFHNEPPPENRLPREPERKKPEGRLTEAQKTELRRKLLRNERIECPDDGAYLEVHDVTAQQSVGREFLIMCPDCGLTDTLLGAVHRFEYSDLR